MATVPVLLEWPLGGKKINTRITRAPGYAFAAGSAAHESLNIAVAAAKMVAFDVDLATEASARSSNAAEFYGIPGLGARMQDVLQHIHPEDRQKEQDAFKAAIQGGEDYSCQVRFVRPRDGRLMWLETHGEVIRDPDGNPKRLCGVVLDVTEKILLEQELTEQTKLAHRASQRKTEFIATLVHELRNPLAPIRNSLSLVGNLEDPVKARALQVIHRQVAALERLIEDLLDVSRIEQGKIGLHLAETDLVKVIEQALEAALPHITERGQHISVQLPGEPLLLELDEGRMVQVVSNLLNNACKFTPRGGLLSLACRRRDRAVFISVKDNGIGIAPEHLKAIFETFFQSATGASRNSGLGLGLSLSSALVNLHGGTLEAKSDGPGKGSEFIVRLPDGSMVEERKID